MQSESAVDVHLVDELVLPSSEARIAGADPYSARLPPVAGHHRVLVAEHVVVADVDEHRPPAAEPRTGPARYIALGYRQDPRVGGLVGSVAMLEIQLRAPHRGTRCKAGIVFTPRAEDTAERLDVALGASGRDVLRSYAGVAAECAVVATPVQRPGSVTEPGFLVMRIAVVEPEYHRPRYSSATRIAPLSIDTLDDVLLVVGEV